MMVAAILLHGDIWTILIALAYWAVIITAPLVAIVLVIRFLLRRARP